MHLSDFLKLINNLLPPQTAMENDRIGIQIQSENDDINTILLTMELNDEVVDEAVNLKCDCIVTFHPLIFNPLRTIRYDDRVGRICSKLIKNSISLISIHTAFDAFENGTSKILADKLGLNVLKFLVPNHEVENAGMGIVGDFVEPILEIDLLKKVSSICNSPIRYSRGKTDKIKTIAIVGGSGSSFLNDAVRANVDAFITADITYHTFHAVSGELTLVDPGHYEMEQFVGQGMLKLFEDNLVDADLLKLYVSKIHTNPVKYFPDNKYEIEQKNILKT